MPTINHNADFLFLYEAINCNPNGDPDQENKPRMDYDTQTNLVTDTRLKRYIRDYFMQQGYDVFVAMENGHKVNPDTKFVAVVEKLLADTSQSEAFFSESNEMKEAFNKIVKEKKSTEGIFKALQSKGNKQLNYYILEKLIRDTFLDIRLFGSAFAVKEFTRAYTGPVQINWGYSLNKVYLIESDSIVTIMNDDNSTFGKDYRVHYSLLGFHGTVNKHKAALTGLSDDDMDNFRDAMWNAIPSLPTRSKLNQYPKLYLEIVYNDGFHNGHFGDLRNLISCKPNAEVGDFKRVRKYNDLALDFSKLEQLIADNKKNGVIRDVIIKRAGDVSFNG